LVAKYPLLQQKMQKSITKKGKAENYIFVTGIQPLMIKIINYFQENYTHRI